MINIDYINKVKIMQQDTSDCGVACLLTLIRFHGGAITLERLRELSGTTKQGTTLLGLYQAAISVELHAEGCEADIQSLIEHAKPIILHVELENGLEHFIINFGYEDNHFVIFDPAKGLCRYTINDLNKIWKSRVCLIILPTDDFYNKKNISKDKKKWFFHLIHKDYPVLGISIVIGLIISILGIAIAVFTQKLVDEIIPNKSIDLLYIGMILLFLLLFFRLGLIALRQYLLYTQSRNFNNRIISFFYNKLLRLPKSFFDTRKTGDLVARLNDTRRIQQVITVLSGDFIINILASIITIAALFYYSWVIGLALLCITPTIILLVNSFNKPIINAQREVMAWYANSESNFINTMQGIDTVKSHNKQNEFGKLNKLIYNSFQDRIFNLGKISIKLSFISGAISTMIITLSIAYGAYQVFNNTIKLGEFMAIINLVVSIMPSIVSLALITIQLNEAKVAFNRMFEFTSIKPENDKGLTLNSPVKSINICNLDFRFTGNKRVLNNVFLSFEVGEMSFIIGESGCGKTTLCHILEKFYSPESGNIIINSNINLESIAIKSWREQIGIMPQEIYFFNGTVLDNICLGLNKISPETVIETCEHYGLGKYISQLPQSYATKIGEDGINLSGGQKQLIALARILVMDPRIILLDEPTSSMDRQCEKFTLELLSAIKKTKIIIVVSHRLHVVKKYADKIYLIENQTINHYGNHTQMMQTENLYSNFWTDLNG
ncbi:peptidase domain-containing ABC transporter [Bacteroides sp. 51]|uniref:peptidase domain-containing ABC transporter n=1 Tax=Bacteroides sp. 51 TaxID=2302938 RepID=UPI0013D1CD6E|nr:peptidase domain-containing ABC transporter [Bacteroides sp. 51]NDV83402.1 peptidase domain-containing ABC transporter [Bacteroides sp. 51]